MDWQESLVCPHCGCIQTQTTEDPSSSDMTATNCERCSREYFYSVRVLRTFASSKTEEDEEE